MKNTARFLISAIIMMGLLVTAFFILPQPAYADTCTSAGGGGDWNNNATWSGCSGVFPDSGDDVVIANGSPVTVNVASAANTLTVETGATLNFDADLTVSGTSGNVLVLRNGIDLDGQILTLNGNGSYNILVDGGARTITGASGSRVLIYTNSDIYTITVASANGGTLVIDTNVTLELKALSNIQTRFDPGSSLTTINGTLKISYGGQVVTNGPFYGDSSTLMFSYANASSSATYYVGAAWPAGTSGSTIPMNVTVSSDYPGSVSTTVQMANNTIRTLRGDLTLGQNGYLGLPGACTSVPTPPGYCGVNLSGDWTNNGGGITGGVSRVGFIGTSQQIIGGSAETDFPNLVINNSSGVGSDVLLEHGIKVSYYLYMTTGNLDLASFDLTLQAGSAISPPYVTDASYSSSKMIIADDAALCQIINGDYELGVAKHFPIGDNTGTLEYSPAKVVFPPESSFAAYSVCVRVINAKQPNLGTSSYFNRYWKVTSTPGQTGTFTFYYKAADVVAISPITEADFYSARYNFEDTDWEIYSNHVVTSAPKNFVATSVGMLDEGDYTPVPDKPTAVDLADFAALPEVDRVRVLWTTGQEIGASGFKVYRSLQEDGSDRSQISDFIFSQAGGAGGADYEFLDTTAQVGVRYYYWVEAVSTDGSSTFFVSAPVALHNMFLPVVKK